MGILQRLFFIPVLIFALTTMAEQRDYWIDVRTAEEFESGHIEGAVNIMHMEIGDKIAAVVTDKTAPIHVYCGSGRRAGMAKDTLEQLGYKNVINEGGYQDIQDKNTVPK